MLCSVVQTAFLLYYRRHEFAVAGKVLGEVPLGSYNIAWNIASAPVEKITNMVTGVTPAYFSAIQNSKSELRRYLLRLIEILSLLQYLQALVSSYPPTIL